jgi:hypothetical protein
MFKLSLLAGDAWSPVKREDLCMPKPVQRPWVKRGLVCAAGAALLGGSALARTHARRDEAFTIALIPDTQNYVDYSHQKAEGFAFDAKELFLEQLQYVSDHLKSQGGDIAFVSGLGDIWQHQSLRIDPEHEARGFKWIANPLMDKALGAPSPRVQQIEMPSARQGYQLIAGKTPFSVVPGNHDYDAMWTDVNHPPSAAMHSLADLGMMHAGGLTNFVSVFGAESNFFRGKHWYVASHDGGADSAQVFTAGGYPFLHIGLQFDPPNASLEWAASVLRRYPGVPTIITTHDFLNVSGQREPSPILDNHAIDPQDNTPQMVWDKFISQHDQIFLVLCGHEHGQAFRVDDNRSGHKVYQILGDYQDRAQTAIDAGVKPSPFVAVGDGWMRLLTFDMGGAAPTVHVHTYSTYYKKESMDTPDYAHWYKAHEKPSLGDEEFRAQDDYHFTLSDFRRRFASR